MGMFGAKDLPRVNPEDVEDLEWISQSLGVSLSFVELVTACDWTLRSTCHADATPSSILCDDRSHC